MGFFEALLGPLAGLEYRRCTSRPWLFWARLAATLPMAVTLLFVAWISWLTQRIHAGTVPRDLVGGSAVALIWSGLAVALVLSPAVLAGTLAGEKAKGTFDLLLSARVSSREIVTSRLLSRLGQIGVLLAAGLPGVAFALCQCGVPLAAYPVLLLLPVAVAFGAGAMALAASAVSRRARDALVAVYLGIAILLWVLPLDPFPTVAALVFDGVVTPAWRSVAWWTALGIIGCGWATWRLRPAYLRQSGRKSGRRNQRGWHVPPVGENPMLWKELHIDRTKTLGWIGRLLGWLLGAALVGGTVVLVAVHEYGRWFLPNHQSLIQNNLFFIIDQTRAPLGWLVQCAIGLRAAVSIASERERGTWDALLASPLDAREIIRAKIAGSLHALRGLIFAVFFCWTVAVAYRGMDFDVYCFQVITLISVGIFMAALGVWFSLTSQSTTTAMTLTLGVWLAAAAALAVLAALLAAVVSLVLLFLYGLFVGGPIYRSWGPMTSFFSFAMLWIVIRCVLYLLIAAANAAHTRARFDQLAGRCPVDPRRSRIFKAETVPATAEVEKPGA